MKNTSKTAKNAAQDSQKQAICEVLSFTQEKRKNGVFHYYLCRRRRRRNGD